MNQLYKKNELTFALVWIGLYVVLLSVADSLSSDLGTLKVVTAPLGAVLTAVLLGWILQNGLTEKYGLVKPDLNGKRYLFYLPLVVVMSVNLWFGCRMKLSALETALHMISMVFVGFLEEVIFRGLLFKAMAKTNLKRAVIISSVTFGLGHIVNLLNGAEVVPTLLQICYAVALGFLFTIIFLKSGSLIPCIVTHSVINALSAIGVEMTNAQTLLVTVALTAISLLYAAWILKASGTTVAAES